MKDWTFGIRKHCRKKILNRNPTSITLTIPESRNEFHAATRLTVESFNNLLEFLNTG